MSPISSTSGSVGFTEIQSPGFDKLSIDPKDLKTTGKGSGEQISFVPDTKIHSDGPTNTTFEQNPDGSLTPEGQKRLDDALALLANAGPELSRMIAEIAIKMATQQQQNALNSRTSAIEAQAQELLSQADTLKSAANDIKNAAITSLVTTVVGSAISIGASIGSGVAAGRTAGKMNAANDVKSLDFAKAEQFGAQAKAFGDAASAVGSMISQGGQIGGKFAESEQKTKEADAQKDAAQATMAQQQVEFAKDVQEQMRKTIESMLGVLKEMNDIDIETMRSIVRA